MRNMIFCFLFPVALVMMNKTQEGEKNRKVNWSAGNAKEVNRRLVAGLPTFKKICIYMLILV